MRKEIHNLDGQGDRPHEVYDMTPHPGYWPAVTDVACPVDGCDQTIVWYEAGYVPGYRVCMAAIPGVSDGYDMDTITHRFLAKGDAASPTLVRMRIP